MGNKIYKNLDKEKMNQEKTIKNLLNEIKNEKTGLNIFIKEDMKILLKNKNKLKIDIKKIFSHFNEKEIIELSTFLNYYIILFV
jgi:uncharacterized protein (DUF302 family)